METKKNMRKQVISWWKKVSFWNKLRTMLGLIGIGGEITLYFGDVYSGWMIVAAIATFICMGITFIVEDANNNGIADIFEKGDKK